MAFLILHRQMAAVTLGDDVVRSQSCSNCYENALPGTTQAGSPRSRLKTEVLELRERSVFVDLADTQTSVADHLATIVTSVCTLALTLIHAIILTNR